MLFNNSNEIDKKIIQIFPEETLKNLVYENLDYFGINAISDSNKDFEFKIYYKNKYSRKLYLKGDEIPFIEFLRKKKMLNFLTFVENEKHDGILRYDIGLKRHNNENMEALFSYLKENCSFYKKYEDEILELSRMKATKRENMDYRSLDFVTLLNNNQILKCHWFNIACLPNSEPYDNEYYFNYIENSSVEGLKRILPKVKMAIKNCAGNIWMEGIDYNEFASQKHKIYIYGPQNIYDGLIKTYSTNKELAKKIKIINEWADIHKELYCDSFAIGEDANKDPVINFYFKMHKEEN